MAYKKVSALFLYILLTALSIITDHVSSVSSVQQWAVSFGKEMAALSARYSGAKLLQKVRERDAHINKYRHLHKQMPTRAVRQTQ